MQKDTVSNRQAISMLALFIIGSSLILGISKNANQDAWIGFLIGFAAFLPIAYVYSRLMARYPGKDVFEICIEVFGPVLGRAAIVLLVWYAIHLGSLVMRNFSGFIQVTTFDQMPQTVSLLSLAFLVIWAARKGVEVLGRSASVMLPILLIIVLATVLLLIKDMHVEYLMPVGENLSAVPKDALSSFTYPFAETVLFLGLLTNIQGGKTIGKPIMIGATIGMAVILFGGFFRNAMVLGFPLEKEINFASFNAVSIVIAGGFLSRIEGLVTANLLMAGFVKISVCLIAASKGVARLINTDDHKPFAAPLGLIMVALASIVYQNTLQMFAFIDVYKYYALPFQVFIPVALAVSAEIKLMIKARREKNGKAPA